MAAGEADMQVFLSWSGDRSRAAAAALREWLPTVLPGVRCWMSSQDIREGDRWLDALNTALNECDAAIACLTSDNRQSEWLLFESGAIAKQIDRARVIPLLIDGSPKDVPVPLRQFQAVPWSAAGLVRIAESLNESLGKHQARASELAARLKSNPPPVQQVRTGRRNPTVEGRRGTVASSANSTWKLDRLGRDILLAAAEAQDRFFTDSITIDDLVDEMDLPRAKAALYLDRLKKARYLTRGGKITHAGTEVLVGLGLL